MDAEGPSPLRFEIVQMETGQELFLSLLKYKFTSTPSMPIIFEVGDEKWEEVVPTLEGGMKIRFPQKLKDRVIDALQQEQEVRIMVDGFEKVLKPENFLAEYKK